MSTPGAQKRAPLKVYLRLYPLVNLQINLPLNKSKVDLYIKGGSAIDVKEKRKKEPKKLKKFQLKSFLNILRLASDWSLVHYNR